MQVINDPESGTAADKLRLFLIYYLCASNMTEQEFNDLSNALSETGSDAKPLIYMKRWKSLMKVIMFINLKHFIRPTRSEVLLSLPCRVRASFPGRPPWTLRLKTCVFFTIKDRA